MKTDDLLRKLSPLMPERVQHWRHVLTVSDPPLRALVEREIAIVARERLGDPDELLLSLPPRERIRGEFVLGVVRYEAPKWPAGITRAELLQNLAIFGRSGAGKTNVLFHLLEQLARDKVPFVFLDWKRTGRHLLPRMPDARVYTPGRQLSPFPFNPFQPPPGLEPRLYASQVADVLATAYTLGDAATSLIENALRSAYASGCAPTPQEVRARVNGVPDKERVRGWKISALRALDTLTGSELATSTTRPEGMIEALLHQQSIIELNGLPSSAKRFLLPLLCLWIYAVRLASPQREKLVLVLVVEEAHHVLYQHRNQHETVMEMLLRQCREIGIAIIVVDQHPHLISSAALGNTYTSICLNLKDPRDTLAAARLSLVPRENAGHFSTLPVGRGVVKLQDRWHQPFLVDFPQVPVEKGSVTDDALQRLLRGQRTLSALPPPPARTQDALGRPRLPDTGVEGLLLDIHHHPNDGVDARYKRLHISADQGTRRKRQLLSLGLVTEQAIKHGRARKHVLRLTAKGAELAGVNATTRHESILHEYWKRWYAHKYQQEGYTVELEATRPAGGNVDILATRASENVAIEIETGKSNAADNVRKNLLSGYHRVLVIATTDKAWHAVWRELSCAGLLVPQVHLVIEDGEQQERS